ncbi:MAG: hypothetical protein HYT13_01525 [Candidatus Liptonbacteria bacterium]|nr:hypothetical protein [Candidatus Liptonbacteria bacterium]
MKNKKGQLSLQVLIFGAVSIIVISGFALWASSFLKFSLRDFNKTLAFSISEAGIEYYRWHLAHAPQDFQDGTGGPGPYVHNYYDKNGIVLGQFSLEITPPATGSTIVKIKSTGQLAADSSIQKIIQVSMGIPSFAKYAVAANDIIRFGDGTIVYGPIHSNGGIRFDGYAYNLITSAVADYDDPDHGGGNEFGVHTHRNEGGQSGVDNSYRPKEAPPPPAPDRPDVFGAGREFPVPAVDFVGITQDLSQIKADAQTNGFYRASSTAYGYEVILKTDDTFDLYRVNSLVSSPSSNCTKSQDQANNQGGWGTWTINSKTLLGNYVFPANGLIFLEDDVWVRGQVDGGRLTIASARFPDNPSTRSSITLNDNLLYTDYNGLDAIALMAQKNINVGWQSQDIIRIDGALVAQNGWVGRYYYNSFCSPYDLRDTITTYGSLVSSQRYGFAYTTGVQTVSGYPTRNLIYDSNLLYGPPPSFPLTSDQYTQISWDEVK